MEFNINDAWDNFKNNDFDESPDLDFENEELVSPKCTDIYISTKTKICFLNKSIHLDNLFWKIPIIPYYKPTNGVIKKQMKITSFDDKDIQDIQDNLKDEPISSCFEISKSTKSKKKKNFKYVQKVNIGLSKKDLTSYRVKQKNAFYNCFALIIRILFQGEFKEVHVKVFNTGKLEIPGIQNDDLLVETMKEIEKLFQQYFSDEIYVNKESINTVLINSNFNCGYYVNREKLHHTLKTKYSMISMYDPCSYPGIQTKFYYNHDKVIQDGICNCDQKCSKSGSGHGKGECIEISFMIFRTGSILIVGHCNESILNDIYEYLKKIMENEFQNINDGILENTEKKKKNKKIKKQVLIFDV